MFRKVFRAAMCGMAALVALSASSVHADDEPFYFCTGAPVEEMQANTVPVFTGVPAKPLQNRRAD